MRVAGTLPKGSVHSRKSVVNVSHVNVWVEWLRLRGLQTEASALLPRFTSRCPASSCAVNPAFGAVPVANASVIVALQA